MAKHSRLRISIWFRSFRKMLRNSFGTDPADAAGLSRLWMLDGDSLVATVPMSRGEKRDLEEKLYDLAAEGKLCLIPDGHDLARFGYSCRGRGTGKKTECACKKRRFKRCFGAGGDFAGERERKSPGNTRDVNSRAAVKRA